MSRLIDLGKGFDRAAFFNLFAVHFLCAVVKRYGIGFRGIFISAVIAGEEKRRRADHSQYCEQNFRQFFHRVSPLCLVADEEVGVLQPRGVFDVKRLHRGGHV